MEEYLKELKQAQDSGLARHIGVSNFTVAQMKQAIEILGDNVLYTNQVEVHPYLQNQQVVEYCRQQNMIVTGYMPFAYGDVLKDGSIKHNCRQTSSDACSNRIGLDGEMWICDYSIID